MTVIQTYQKRVFDAAIKCGLQETQARIIVAQAQHETANFSSNVFGVDNNCFGMKMPSTRSRQYIEHASFIVNLTEGTSAFAHYQDLEHSVQDLILGWHAFNHTDWRYMTSTVAYAIYLKNKGYYGDSEENYQKAIAKFFLSNGWLKVDSFSGGDIAKVVPAIVVALIGIYFLSS